METLDHYHTNTMDIQLDTKGRVHVTFLDKKIILLEDAKIYFHYLKSVTSKFQLRLPRPVCLDIRPCLSISSDASQYAASQLHCHSTIAIIVDDKESIQGINFALKMKELDYPARAFVSIEEGIDFITCSHAAKFPKEKYLSITS